MIRFFSHFESLLGEKSHHYKHSCNLLLLLTEPTTHMRFLVVRASLCRNDWSLYQAMDKMREPFDSAQDKLNGDRKVIRAAGMDAKSISRWNPFNGEPPPLLANRRR